MTEWDDVVRIPRTGQRWQAASPPLGDVLLVAYPAVPDSVAVARHELERWLARAELTPELVEAARLAASEALSNVVRHAYTDRPGTGTMQLAALVEQGVLCVIVSDHGNGFRAHGDSGGLGLGLSLIAKLADSIDLISPEDGGFELQMRFNV